MKKSDFFTKVARKADTKTQAISASEVSRVLRVAGDVLGSMSAAELLDTLQKWVKKPKKK